MLWCNRDGRFERRNRLSGAFFSLGCVQFDGSLRRPVVTLVPTLIAALSLPAAAATVPMRSACMCGRRQQCPKCLMRHIRSLHCLLLL